jgi:hypothetical protein
MRIPLHTNKTLKIAFEFGMLLSESATNLKIPLTKEIAEEAESILLNELKINGTNSTALNFTPLILAVLSTTKETKKTPS